jgi:hypothetical protein
MNGIVGMTRPTGAEDDKSYPPIYAQMWVKSANSRWKPPIFIVDNSWNMTPHLWITSTIKHACG